jgi:hypothetical protein
MKLLAPRRGIPSFFLNLTPQPRVCCVEDFQGNSLPKDLRAIERPNNMVPLAKSLNPD